MLLYLDNIENFTIRVQAGVFGDLRNVLRMNSLEKILEDRREWKRKNSFFC